jgi:hypothetical protein
MNLWECIIDAANETETGNPSASTIPTLNEYIRWANRGQDIICNASNCLEQLITASTVAKQQKYTMPARFIRPMYTEWIEATQSNKFLSYMDIKAFRLRQAYSFETSTPEVCTVWNKNFHIYPAVSSAAAATTLTGSHSATATTITVASTSGFPSTGRLIIGSEVIEYTGTTSTTCTGAERGVEGTTAAAHSDTDAVTERDLRIYSSVRYLIRAHNIYSTGTAAFTKSSTSVTGTSTLWTNSPNAYPTWEIGTGTNPTKWYTISSITDDTTIVLTSAFEEENVSTTNYVLSSVLEIPVEYSDALTLYLIARTYKRREKSLEAQRTMQEFYAKIAQANSELINRGTQYPSMHDGRRYDY